MTVSIVEIPWVEPTEIRAGDTAVWKKGFADYPATAWTLAYTLINSTSKISITSTASGSDHYVEISAATTGAWTVGNYDWIATVTKTATSERYTIGTGRLEVLKNLAATALTTYDNRSHARIMLDAIEATLEARATDSQLDILVTSVGDRSITKDRETLITLRNRYRAEVAAEERAAGLRPRRVLARFQ